MRPMTSSIVSGEHGFMRKSRAPRCSAATAVSTVPWAVTMTLGRSGYSAKSRSTSSEPSISGMRRSETTRSGQVLATSSSASAPLSASSVS